MTKFAVILLAITPFLRASSIHIMPLGDSITAGYTGAAVEAPGGFRNHLYSGLTNAGISLTFDGSTSQNASPLLIAAGQTLAEGHSGYLIAGVPYPSFPGGFYPGLYENLDNWFSAFQPDVVLLMIGTNDVNMNIDLPNAPGRLGNLLDRIHTDDPAGRIVLSTLIGALDANLNASITTYNTALPTVAASRPFVTLVDNANVLNLSTDYASTLHPNRQGYDKLGDALATEVEAVLAPEPSTFWLTVFCGCALIRAARAKRKQQSLQPPLPTTGI